MSQWPHQSEVDAFYGNPRGKNGEPSAKWESENIVRLTAPWKLVTAWDFQPVKGIRIHKKCEKSLSAVLDLIWQVSGKNEAKIKEALI